MSLDIVPRIRKPARFGDRSRMARRKPMPAWPKPSLIAGAPLVEAVRVPMRGHPERTAVFSTRRLPPVRWTTTRWPRGFPISCGAACPTTKLFETRRQRTTIGTGCVGEPGRPDARGRPFETFREGFRGPGVPALRNETRPRRIAVSIRNTTTAWARRWQRRPKLFLGETHRREPRRRRPDRCGLHLRQPAFG